MKGWEYLTIPISYDDKKHKDWLVKFTEQPPLVGLTAILETYGSHGWELVSLEPERMEAFPGFGKWTIEPASYRATFKRPKED
jgi:hypothetical protein